MQPPPLHTAPPPAPVGSTWEPDLLSLGLSSGCSNAPTAQAVPSPGPGLVDWVKFTAGLFGALRALGGQAQVTGAAQGGFWPGAGAGWFLWGGQQGVWTSQAEF